MKLLDRLFGRHKEQLDRIEQQLKEHDSYVRDSVATKTSIKESSDLLLQQLQQQLPQLPQKLIDVVTVTAEISDKHREIIKFFMSQEFPDEYFSYSEIAENLQLKEPTVRAYVQDLIKLGYDFDKKKYGKKMKLRVKPDLLQQLLTGK